MFTNPTPANYTAALTRNLVEIISWKEWWKGGLRCDSQLWAGFVEHVFILSLSFEFLRCVSHARLSITRVPVTVGPDSGSIRMYKRPGAVWDAHTPSTDLLHTKHTLNTHITACSSTADAERSRRGEWGNTAKKSTGHLSSNSQGRKLRKYSITGYKYFTWTLFNCNVNIVQVQ